MEECRTPLRAGAVFSCASAEDVAARAMATLSLGADATVPPAILQTPTLFDGAADTPSDGECRTGGAEEPAPSIASATTNISRGASSSSPLPPNSSATSIPPASGSTAVARVAGMQTALQAVRELVVWPLLYREDGAALGVRWPRGLLLYGPPGCGKTLLVQAVAAEASASLHVVTAARVTGAYTGESERRLREAFARAQEDADAGQVAVVFLDEVDALCPRREGGRAHDSRVVAQLLTLLDGATTGGNGSGGGCKGGGHLVVVGATNRPNAIDPALRRPGRLDREVLVALPDAEQRKEILGSLSSHVDVSSDSFSPPLTRNLRDSDPPPLSSLSSPSPLPQPSPTSPSPSPSPPLPPPTTTSPSSSTSPTSSTSQPPP
ncbi:hypothetical protein Vafri_2043 [Volvox africanus]|nr:hypothetical protein Vafri_2043 [Volvox africanus]